MTTPRPDEPKALIAKLRDYRIREQPHRFFLDVADALEAAELPAQPPAPDARERAIVENLVAAISASDRDLCRDYLKDAVRNILAAAASARGD